MYPKLLTLYGPFELNSYNTAIIIGIGIFMYCTSNHPALKKLMSRSAFFNLIIESALVGIIGARLLHLVSSWQEYSTWLSMLRLWDGGLSVLGAFIAIVSYGYWSLDRQGISFISVIDCAALYAPLIHAIARIGCFLVGCCHGAPTNVMWAVTYTHPQVMAPLHVALHPSQLYSAGLFFLLFLILKAVSRTTWGNQSGHMILLYTLGMSLERFSVDFVRGDRIMLSYAPISFHQVVAGALFLGAITLWIVVRQTSAVHYESL